MSFINLVITIHHHLTIMVKALTPNGDAKRTRHQEVFVVRMLLLSKSKPRHFGAVKHVLLQRSREQCLENHWGRAGAQLPCHSNRFFLARMHSDIIQLTFPATSNPGTAQLITGTIMLAASASASIAAV